MDDHLRSDDIRDVLDETLSDVGSDLDLQDIPSDHSGIDFSSGSEDNYEPNLNDLDSSDEDVNNSNVNRPVSPSSNTQPTSNPWVRVYPPEPEKDVSSDFKVRTPGICDCPPRNSNPISYALLFFTVAFWNHITKETNAYANKLLNEKRNSGSLKPFSRIKKWCNVTLSEMRKYFAIIINMGINADNRPMSSYWDTRDSQYIPFYANTMTSNRFFLINSHLHLTSRDSIPKGQPGYDPLIKIRYVYDYLSKAFKKFFKPFQNICIDESLIGMKNRCPFIQYLPNKKHKQYGIKKFELCDSLTNYVYHIEFYFGKGYLASNDNQPFTEKVIFEILNNSNLFHKGHHLFTDNFYTKIPLAKKLIDRDTYLTGTINKRSKFLPDAVKTTKLGARESIYFRQGDILLVSYKQTKSRKPVYVITTASHAEDKLIQSKKTNLQGMKPILIHKYNQFMGGIDVSDKSIYHNSCNRQTTKYWKKMFFNLIDIALYNAYVLYRSNTDKPMARRDFLISIVDSLIELQDPQPVIDIGPGGDTGNHKLQKLPGNSERRCIVCSTPEKRARTRFFCPGCNCGVHRECFHKMKHFLRPAGQRKKRKAPSNNSDSE